MVLCGQQSVNDPKSVLHLKFFKEATFCSDDSFAYYWHSVNHLHGSHLECFSVKDVPRKKLNSGSNCFLNAFETISCVASIVLVYSK